jgi:hypothetical protein
VGFGQSRPCLIKSHMFAFMSGSSHEDLTTRDAHYSRGSCRICGTRTPSCSILERADRESNTFDRIPHGNGVHISKKSHIPLQDGNVG